MKELSSGDVDTQEKAVEKADCLVASLEKEKTGKSHINRTVINRNPSCGSRPVVHNAIFLLSALPTRACKRYVLLRPEV